MANIWSAVFHFTRVVCVASSEWLYVHNRFLACEYQNKDKVSGWVVLSSLKKEKKGKWVGGSQVTKKIKVSG